MKKRLLSGQIDAPASSDQAGEAPDMLDRPVRAVYDGTFNSMDGEVTLTPEQIDLFAKNHNAKIESLTAGGAELKLSDCPPLQLDHSESARDTIGRLYGRVEAKSADVPGIGIKRCLFGTARFIGKENTQPARDGRFASVSVGIDLDNFIIDELSIVPFPAAEHAALLSKGRFSMKPEHLKHFLVSCKGMSEDDALKHMGGLDEEGRGKLEEETKEHLKKLGVEPTTEEQGSTPAKPGEATEQGALADDPKDKDHLGDGDGDEDDEPKDEKGKKEFARRKKQSAALKQAKEQLRLAQVQLRRGEIKSRLMRLRAEAKVTPAEIKSLEEKRFGAKKVELHELDEVAVDAILGTFELREPVIPTGHMGSMRGVDLASMGEAVKKARLAEMETETLSNMPFTRAALANTREAEGTSAQLSGRGEGKVVRLMNDEGYQPAPRVEDPVPAAMKTEAEEALNSQRALSAQMQSLSAIVSTLESTI